MTDVPSSFFFDFFLYLFIPFLCTFFLLKLRITPVIGYIVGGIILGNLFDGLISKEVISNFAYLGIVILLFTIGLQINFEKLTNLKKFIIIGGLLQITFSLLLLTFLSILFSFNFIQALLIGIALSSSSTALVAKIIEERGEASSFIGEISLGILMFQDLAFIPFLIFFSVADFSTAFSLPLLVGIIKIIGKAIFGLFVLYYLGKRLVPFVVHKVAKASRELLNLFIILFIFFIGFLSSYFNIPILIGAFVSGILISKTIEHYHIFSQVRLLRDLLTILFFVFIGIHVKIASILPLLPTILLFSIGVLLIKGGVLLFIFLYLRFSSRIAFSIASFLFQVSENAFILLSLAFTKNLFTSEQYLLTISVVLITLTLTHPIINSKDYIYMSIRDFFKKYIPSIEIFITHRLDFVHSPINQLNIKNHIIICGYGRVGSQIGRALLLANIPFIAIDYNFYIVERAKKEGVYIVYGDPSDIDILDFAHAEYAKALISVTPGISAQEAIVLNAKKLNPHLLVISRVHTTESQQRIKALGADIVVQPESEAALSIIKKIFILAKLSKDEIKVKVRHFKLEQGI